MKGRLDHRGYAIWSAIAGALFLVVAFAGFAGQGWTLRRILCLIGGVCNLGISVREFRRAKSSGQAQP